MKKVILIFAFGAIGLGAKAQIKISSSGNVGIGVTAPYCKLQILDGANEYVFSKYGGINFGGHQVGESVTRLDFWHPTAGWNKVRFKGYTLSSDSTLKTDILPLEEVTDVLKQVKTYSYYFKSDCIDERQRDYGVLAQEIADILPDLVDTAKGNLLVNYNAFIAFLIKGFNEQQTVIETLQDENAQQQAEIEILQNIAFGQELDLTELHELRLQLNEMREMILACCEGTIPIIRGDTSSPQNKIQQVPVLYQNTPNPFTSNTEISCDIPTAFNSAFIYVYNLQGVELMSFPIVQTGFSTVVVYASTLPAGMYLYALVVDDEIIDTKRMILTK